MGFIVSKDVSMKRGALLIEMAEAEYEEIPEQSKVKTVAAKACVLASEFLDNFKGE